MRPGVVRGFPRPWPVDPAQYPFNCPSCGRVYMPTMPDEPPTPLWVKALWAIVGGTVFACAWVAVVAFSAALGSALFG